jgi:hypothetical protein
MKVSTATIGMAAVLALAASAGAATITSGNFSIGYGFSATQTGSGWTTTETAAQNVGLTGDFGLSIDPTSSLSSSGGPIFTNRVLQTGTNGSRSGWPTDFQATITGSYTGTPADAASNPDYHIQVSITEISIYGTDYYVDGTLGFNETTPGNTQSQTPQTINSSSLTNGWDAAAYTQVSWDPTDVSVAGLSQTRTFTLSPSSRSQQVDGFEVFGNVVVIYNAVPEPASMGLLAAGGLLLMRRRRPSAKALA